MESSRPLLLGPESGGGDAGHTTIFCFAEVLSLAWEPSNRLLLAGTSSGLIKLWNVKSNQSYGELAEKSQRLCPRVVDLAYSPTQPQFASAAHAASAFQRQGALCVWDSRQLQMERSLPLPPDVAAHALAYAPGGQVLFAGCSDGRVLAFDSRSSAAVLGWAAHRGRVAALALSRDGGQLLTAGGDGAIYQWSVASLQECVRASASAWRPPSPGVQTTDISFHASDKQFAIPSQDNTTSIYQIPSRVNAAPPVRRFSSHSKSVICLDWHPSENILATGSEDRTVHLHKF